MKASLLSVPAWPERFQMHWEKACIKRLWMQHRKCQKSSVKIIFIWNCRIMAFRIRKRWIRDCFGWRKIQALNWWQPMIFITHWPKMLRRMTYCCASRQARKWRIRIECVMRAVSIMSNHRKRWHRCSLMPERLSRIRTKLPCDAMWISSSVIINCRNFLCRKGTIHGNICRNLSGTVFMKDTRRRMRSSKSVSAMN